MNKLKKEKGITLVALIITIVVLLILAIVTIGAVKDSNIIAHAENAKNSYTIAQEKEQIGLAVSEWQLQKVIPENTKSFYEVVDVALHDTAEVADNHNGTLTVRFYKTSNMYIVDENGNINKQDDNKENEDQITGDFEITVTQYPDAYGNAADKDAVRLTITPTIPDSWKKVYTEDERDLAAADVARSLGVTNSDGSEITTLEQLLIAGGNTIEGLPKQYAKDEYEEMMQVISTLTTEDISTPEKAFVFMMGQMGLSYTTVQEWATDMGGFNHNNKSLRIRRNGGEWQDVTEDARWNDIEAEIIIELNGIYDIEMILDNKKAVKEQLDLVKSLGIYVKYDANGNNSVEDETILWRLLRNDEDKVELITADALGSVNLEPVDANDAKNKYNDLVNILVTECKRVTGIEKNIRNVGAPATEEALSDTNTVDFSTIEGFTRSVSDEYFAQHEGNINGIRIGEGQIYEELAQLTRAGVRAPENNRSYWNAFRYMQELRDTILFGVGYECNLYGFSTNDRTYLLEIDHDAQIRSYHSNTAEYIHGVRPILTLEPGALDKTTQAGTKDDPIQIYQNK